MMQKRYMKNRVSRSDVIAVLVAIVVCVGLYSWAHYASRVEQTAEQQRREAALPDQWFIVNNIAVPDFMQGNDPIITYSREVRASFFGNWAVEIYKVGSSEIQVCSGSGNNAYTPKESLPAAGVTLSWFMGKRCELEPGKYFLTATWIIHAEGYPEKRTGFTSNPFTVIPRGAQLYITPEQVQQLKTE